MSNQWFQFKKFTIKQHKTAMKVGTDGVLLGAWVDSSPCKILDIGTGTGLIALMLAQRNPKAHIDAIEIEPDAYWQACENVNASGWKSQINIQNCSLQKYILKNKKKYDLIVCNPPFYTTNYPSNDIKRSIARHSTSLELHELINNASTLLSEKGKMSFIFPTDQLLTAKEHVKKVKLNINKLTYVKPTPRKHAHRVLIEIGCEQNVIESVLTIEEDARHQYSQQFIDLLKDFYLKF